MMENTMEPTSSSRQLGFHTVSRSLWAAPSRGDLPRYAYRPEYRGGIVGGVTQRC